LKCRLAKGNDDEVAANAASRSNRKGPEDES
jgi:hypothetical protein